MFGQYFMANKLTTIIKKSAKHCTLCYSICGFFDTVHIASGKLTKFPPAIVSIPVRAQKNQPKKFLFSRFVKILAGTFPLSADPWRVFFITLILIQSSRYRRRQRIATYRYRYDLNRDPPAIVFFAAEGPWFNLGAYWVVKPLKCVFYYLKGRGPLKKSKKFAGMLTN
jgi:hypothetical protein